MQKVKQVVRLYGQGKGTKAISSSLTIARNTIKKYLQIFHSSGIDYETFFKMSDSDLAAMLHVSTSQTPKPGCLVERSQCYPTLPNNLNARALPGNNCIRSICPNILTVMPAHALTTLFFCT